MNDKLQPMSKYDKEAFDKDHKKASQVLVLSSFNVHSAWNSYKSIFLGICDLYVP